MMSSELDSLSNVFVSPRVHNETKCVMPPPRYWHGSFETLMCDKSSVPSSNLEPTPINPNGIVTVPKVTFTYDSPLGRNEEDQSFLASLRDLLKSQDSFSSIRSMDTPGLPRKFSEVGSEIEAPEQWGDVSTFPHRSDDGVAWGEEENVKLNLKHFVTDKDEEGEESNSGTSTNTRGKSFSSIACCCSTSCITSSLPSKSSSPTADASSKNHDARSIVFRSNQSVQWNKRYKEMITFHEKYGHCLVPLNWPTNPSLAHWVKRQRHQYRAKLEGKRSTLTPDRLEMLERLDFVWDSHASGWEERWKELREFRTKHGHCRVPKTYSANPQLAIWVKCQRRQFKLYSEGKDSNMTKERIEKLAFLGFVFTPRKQTEDHDDVFPF